jgi:hypothetical protein
MFKTIETYGRLIVFGLVVLLIAGFAGCSYWESKKNAGLQVTTQIQKGVIKNLDETLEMVEASKRLEDKIRLDVIQKDQKVRQKQAAAVTALEKKLQAIEQKYEAQPKTAVNVKHRSDEVSYARISSVWDTWCAHVSQKTNPMCQPALGTIPTPTMK